MRGDPAECACRSRILEGALGQAQHEQRVGLIPPRREHITDRSLSGRRLACAQQCEAEMQPQQVVAGRPAQAFLVERGRRGEPALVLQRLALAQEGPSRVDPVGTSQAAARRPRTIGWPARDQAPVPPATDQASMPVSARALAAARLRLPLAQIT